MSDCDLCGDWPVRLSPKCHPTAPLRVEMEDPETIAFYCYVPECNRLLGKFKLDSSSHPFHGCQHDEAGEPLQSELDKIQGRTDYPDLAEYVETNYGRTLDKIHVIELWQIVDQVGPFVVGGPQKQKDPKAKLIQDQALALISTAQLVQPRDQALALQAARKATPVPFHGKD